MFLYITELLPFLSYQYYSYPVERCEIEPCTASKKKGLFIYNSMIHGAFFPSPCTQSNFLVRNAGQILSGKCSAPQPE